MKIYKCHIFIECISGVNLTAGGVPFKASQKVSRSFGFRCNRTRTTTNLDTLLPRRTILRPFSSTGLKILQLCVNIGYLNTQQRKEKGLFQWILMLIGKSSDTDTFTFEWQTSIQESQSQKYRSIFIAILRKSLVHVFQEIGDNQV